ncbi:actin cortical patch SUR7/pH-response regulator pali [Aspergillus coremiiformis]|uniref:Actin cortical patch SUR7/pH-response regulator pali n=1 Tax=Aspergillus coremiiformis TaxID=138285 RepID=A0A5N6Z082_9EURO|nr:actin cortical patch SUR7/pH-response regulator pali [Aspergillus coremiiformis]
MPLSWSNTFPTLTAFIACILGLLCLFAGTKTHLLIDTDLFTIYTSNIANGTGMRDFYSIYVMSYCEGFLNPDSRTVTECSHRSVLFSFNATEAISTDAGNTTSLSRLGWPSSITEDLRTFSATSRSMGVFYSIGIGLAGLAVLERLWFGIFKGPRQTVVEVSSLMLSFAMFSIPSIIATVIALQFISLINHHGKESGVTATYGQQFLGMTWAAVGLLLVGGMVSLLTVLVDRGRSEDLVGEPEPKTVSEDSDSVESQP